MVFVIPQHYYTAYVIEPQQLIDTHWNRSGPHARQPLNCCQIGLRIVKAKLTTEYVLCELDMRFNSNKHKQTNEIDMLKDVPTYLLPHYVCVIDLYARHCRSIDKRTLYIYCLSSPSGRSLKQSQLLISELRPFNNVLLLIDQRSFVHPIPPPIINHVQSLFVQSSARSCFLVLCMRFCVSARCGAL